EDQRVVSRAREAVGRVEQRLVAGEDAEARPNGLVDREFERSARGEGAVSPADPDIEVPGVVPDVLLDVLVGGRVVRRDGEGAVARSRLEVGNSREGERGQEAGPVPDSRVGARRAADRGAPDRGAPDRRAPDRRAPDRRAPDRRGEVRRAPDGWAPDGW